MLHRLEIENFYSIRECQVIDLRADAHAPEEPGRLAPLWPGSAERAPKVVALFGANASGKSNVLKALAFVAWFVKDSFGWPRDKRMPFDRFNDHAMLQAPMRLAVDFAGPDPTSPAEKAGPAQCRYSYEFSIGGGEPQNVLSETLHCWPAAVARRTRLFERRPDGSVTASKAFDLAAGFRQALDKVLRPNASVIATLAQLEHPPSKRLWTAASLIICNILVERSDFSVDVVTKHYAAYPKLMEVFNREIERIDVGIRSMQMENTANGPVARFIHEGLALPMPMSYESHGTREFIKLYPLILSALETGGIAVIDELDTSIHPLILPEILRWFADPGRNPLNGQLWTSCHNASLLEDLIKEEVFFCEKNSSGRTSVYGLSNIKSVRRADNYYRKYLGGVFGAVPHVG